MVISTKTAKAALYCHNTLGLHSFGLLTPDWSCKLYSKYKENCLFDAVSAAQNGMERWWGEEESGRDGDETGIFSSGQEVAG